jgi:hypothetical protein
MVGYQIRTTSTNFGDFFLFFSHFWQLEAFKNTFLDVFLKVLLSDAIYPVEKRLRGKCKLQRKFPN